MRHNISHEFRKINDWLFQSQGVTPAGGPKFKLVWSDNETELRKGEFNEFYGSIFLRSFSGIKEVPKYSYIQERWILEMWIPYANKELPESENKGTYEPFWVFSDKKGNYLRPTMKAVQFLVEFTQKTARVPSMTRASELREEDQIQLDKEIAEFMDRLDTSPLLNSLEMRDAVGYTKGLK